MGHFGPKGFIEPVRVTLEPYVEFESGTFVRFAGVPGREMAEIVSHLPEAVLNERQNDGPTIESLICLADVYPSVTFEGYLILPPREDERVSIDGFSVFTCEVPSLPDLWERLDAIRFADEFDTDSKGQTYRLWWD